MTRQLNLRVNDEFAERLERLSRQMGRPMAAVLEAIEKTAEADIQFEAEALAAWEDYHLTDAHMTADAVDALFEGALYRAKSVAEKRRG